MYYSLNYDTLEEMKAIIGSIADDRSHQESCCCESQCCLPDKALK
jgi:hypothetical protein